MTMRQRLAHIAFGGVLVLSGMIASSLLQTSDAQQSQSDIVKAREFHVVNENGATAAVIASHPSGKGLAIKNAFGRVGMNVIIDSDGGSLSIQDSNGKVAVLILPGSNGGSLSIQDSNGELVAGLSAGSEGGFLSVHDAKNESSVFLGQNDEKNGGLITVRGANGFAQISIDEHGGVMSVFGKGSDKSRAVMGVNEYGNGAVSTWDKNGYRQR